MIYATTPTVATRTIECTPEALEALCALQNNPTLSVRRYADMWIDHDYWGVEFRPYDDDSLRVRYVVPLRWRTRTWWGFGPRAERGPAYYPTTPLWLYAQ